MATETASFGAGKRESHDSSAFYRRRLHPAAEPPPLGEPVVPPDAILNTLHCQSSERMEQIPDDCVALMVTSPPYNVGKEYDEDLTHEEYLALLDGVLRETYRVLEPGGRVAVNVANLGRKPYLAVNHVVAGLLRDLGFLLRGEIIWQKAQGAGGSCAWGSWQSAKNPTLRDLHEYVLVASKGSFRRLRIGEDSIDRDEFLAATLSVWNIPPASARRIGHPAPFPVDLPKRLIELYTFRGDLVLDPFIGSGSTAVAAVETGRHYIGYDTVADYLDIARQRVARAVVPAGA
ncbi:MAG: site-specific DNA-methyltransferase [Actinobacteria bacterium]|nr:site-specific DNA-methyltransferase [Actinomycetota bacterium]MBU1494324.1 site-specific DNA-methyltransferase [Actinomycetota bacterium]